MCGLSSGMALLLRGADGHALRRGVGDVSRSRRDRCVPRSSAADRPPAQKKAEGRPTDPRRRNRQIRKARPGTTSRAFRRPPTEASPRGRSPARAQVTIYLLRQIRARGRSGPSPTPPNRTPAPQTHGRQASRPTPSPTPREVTGHHPGPAGSPPSTSPAAAHASQRTPDPGRAAAATTAPPQQPAAPGRRDAPPAEHPRPATAGTPPPRREVRLDHNQIVCNDDHDVLRGMPAPLAHPAKDTARGLPMDKKSSPLCRRARPAKRSSSPSVSLGTPAIATQHVAQHRRSHDLLVQQAAPLILGK
jgi:hypothetical protein